jgi:hypothetical protein
MTISLAAIAAREVWLALEISSHIFSIQIFIFFLLILER